MLPLGAIKFAVECSDVLKDWFNRYASRWAEETKFAHARLGLDVGCKVRHHRRDPLAGSASYGSASLLQRACHPEECAKVAARRATGKGRKECANGANREVMGGVRRGGSC